MGTGYRTHVALHDGSAHRSLDTPITNDTRNRIDLDISDMAPRAAITWHRRQLQRRLQHVPWGGNFDIDDVDWTDQQS